MKKETLWNMMKDEIVYWALIVAVSSFFLYLTTQGVSHRLLMAVGVLNLLLLETWFIRAFLLFSGRKVSQYSEIIQRISLKDRFFDYFVFPVLFLTTFMFFLYFNKNILMSYWVTALCMFVLMVLFVNIKSSLRKVYRISSLTRGIFSLICILSFYLSINVILRFDINIWVKLVASGGLGLLMFLSELLLHDRLTFGSFLLSLLSSLFVALSIGAFVYQSVFVATAIGTVSFYIIVALWNVRFSGKYKFVDYLSPLLYGIITLILIFNL